MQGTLEKHKGKMTVCIHSSCESGEVFRLASVRWDRVATSLKENIAWGHIRKSSADLKGTGDGFVSRTLLTGSQELETKGLT